MAVQKARSDLESGSHQSIAGSGNDFFKQVKDVGGFDLPKYDFAKLVQTALVDTWTHRIGGSGGNIVAVIVTTFTDSTRDIIDTIERTT